MQLFALEKKALLRQLKSSENGLSSALVARRLREFGPNVLERAAEKNYLLAYCGQYTQFFAILLEVAALLSFIADAYLPGQGSDILGYAILGAVIINATFTFWQEYRVDKAMEALLKLIPTLVSVKRNGEVVQTQAEELVPGDIMLLEEGDKVAADGILLAANSLYLNLASLNGESAPAFRTTEPSKASRPLEAKNMIFAGTTVVSGSGLAVASATGNATEFGKIASLTKNVRATLTPMQREIIHITRILTVIALIMGCVFFALGFFSGKGILMASIFALSLIVANVPEGLLPTITLSLSLASQRMARRNALIKNLDSVETLGRATVICTDKTGTLTRNEMTLKLIWLAGGEEVNISGEGYREPGEFSFDQQNESTESRLVALLTAGLLNCRATISEDNLHGDPTELAIVAAAQKKGVQVLEMKKVQEFIFTSDRKMMSSIYQDGNETRLFAKGAVEVLLPKCTTFLAADGSERPLSETKRQEALARASIFENQAFRVLLIACGQKEEEDDLTLMGLVAIMDLPRSEVFEAMITCKAAGIRTMMITGDNPRTAAAIAHQIGMDFDRVITGPELETVRDEELEQMLVSETVLFARMASNQKLRIATALQNNGEVVAMTGDGVNDAPALKKADLGIAMGLSGTEVAKEAADMVLLDDNFSSIVIAIEEGRSVYFNIKKFVTYILSSNVPEIVPYILQFFLMIPLPLSVIQILSIDLGTDMLPGLALGSEKPEKNIMNRPPVGRGEKILDWEVFKRGYFFLGVIEATSSMAAFLSFLLLHGWQYGTVDLVDPFLHRQAMTMTLLGAVSCQLLNAWTMRSWEFSAFSLGFFSNRLMLLAMAVELVWVWALLNVEPVQKVFNTAHVPLGELWILLPFPVLLFLSHEGYKLLRRHRSS
ncbi:MAG: cation-transporting P-type ATPase [Proteobacteria bacterium]|nr:cation-transporting P-type ATPase [Pseudomonadota bacterium]MBU1648856.1 cation-transporting P-type ATPase [Pseudomonadota bacterium]MBU1985991.1 cation-transporting P-type ATPase [Pseudomonadota bacterium]